MRIRPTQEEFNIVNTIIPHIPFNKDFEIYSIIAEVILKPKYPNGKGGVDLAQCDLSIADYRKRGVFKNIETYLHENFFVEKVGEHNANGIFKLTPKGEALVAYGSMYEFLNNEQKSKEDEVVARIPDLIAQAFPYGEFVIEYSEPNMEIVNINIYTADESGELAKLKKALDPKEQLKRMYKQSLLDEEVMQYLVNNGFAVNRHDIKEEGKIYRQLTDKGRKLKELGSIAAYNDYTEKSNRKTVLQDRRVGYLYWINFWIAVGTVVVGVYTLFQMFDYYKTHRLNLQHLFYFLTGALSGVISTIIVVQILKIRLSRERH